MQSICIFPRSAEEVVPVQLCCDLWAVDPELVPVVRCHRSAITS